MFQVEMLPAAHGDCLVISYGKEAEPRHILIDAGTQPTWDSAIRQYLQKGTHFELFVLTHIDADHIGGAIPLLREGTDLSFDDIWFNGWKHLPKTVLSAKQGEIFSTLITEREIPWNHAFEGRAVAVSPRQLPAVEFKDGMRITLLSPTPRKLAQLARKWKREIQRHGLRPGYHRQFRQFLARHPTTTTDVTALASMGFRSDSSTPNGSSIAFLAEYRHKEKDVAVLFTGDAHASVLCRSIKQLLAERAAEKLHLDAFKVSHHGSRGNTNEQLLSLLDCPRYLISCNGEVHNLPDNETIGRIIAFGGPEPELVFNYHCGRTQAWEDCALQRRYKYSANYGDQGYHRLDLLG